MTGSSFYQGAAIGVLLSVFFAGAGLGAEDELPEGSVDVELAFASSYIWRGVDFHKSRIDQTQGEVDHHNEAWTFQPSITFNTPDSGLYFNLWANVPLNHRRDIDTDGVLQTSPGGDDILDGKSGAEQDAAIIDQLTVGSTCGTGCTDPQTTTAAYELITGARGAPAYYEEENGLKRADELDLTIGYESETTAGLMGFGIVTYTSANPVGKFNSQEEMFFYYGLPFLPQFTVSVYVELDDNGPLNDGKGTYYQASLGDSLEITEGVEVYGSVSAGYTVASNIQGWQDVTGDIGVSAFGFFVAYNIAYRPDTRFHESNYESGPTAAQDHLPVWLVGQSTRGDGLIPDLSRGNASNVENRGFNTDLQTFLDATNGTSLPYTYTPRQKLPRYVWWVTLGYGFSI